MAYPNIRRDDLVHDQLNQFAINKHIDVIGGNIHPQKVGSHKGFYGPVVNMGQIHDTLNKARILRLFNKITYKARISQIEPAR